MSGYFNHLSDLWEGFKDWLDKCRSGQISITRPNLVYHVNASPDENREIVESVAKKIDILCL